MHSRLVARRWWDLPLASLDRTLIPITISTRRPFSSSNHVPTSNFSIQGKFRQGRAAYLDMSATTPLDPRVLDAMAPFMVGRFGNPHSRTHSYGWESEQAVERAREQIANLIGASAKEIIFTSGATESNNLSIKGVAHFYGKIRDSTLGVGDNNKRHVITTQTEHKCVLDSCRSLEQEGYDVTYLPVQHSTGRIDMQELDHAIRKDTMLVSIMAVNNEIGTLQPLEEIGQLCRKRKVFFHTDAAQMLGKMPMDVNTMNIDLMSMSGHKIYGPKVCLNCVVYQLIDIVNDFFLCTKRELERYMSEEDLEYD